MRKGYYIDSDTPMIRYQEMINSEIFVDKNMLVEKINKKIRTDGKYICITRPRRFGKTINANMLAAFYTKGYDSQELFNGLEISKTDRYREHLNRHHVIFMDLSQMPDICFGYMDYISNILQKLKADLMEIYPALCNKEYFMLSRC